MSADSGPRVDWTQQRRHDYDAALPLVLLDVDTVRAAQPVGPAPASDPCGTLDLFGAS